VKTRKEGLLGRPTKPGRTLGRNYVRLGFSTISKYVLAYWNRGENVKGEEMAQQAFQNNE
jgi:hypothetical protein